MMPTIGEIKGGKKLGYKCSNRFIWHACIDCGKERWVILFKDKPQRIRCQKCNGIKKGKEQLGANGYNWKGGRHHHTQGYMMIYLYPEDPFFPMTYKNYVKEHRLVMAQYLGRCLESWEIVHHINHIRDDNRKENLQIMGDGEHKGITELESKIDKLQKENILLKSKNKELQEKLWEKTR